MHIGHEDKSIKILSEKESLNIDIPTNREEIRNSIKQEIN